MKKTKRILYLALCAAFLLVSLSGCMMPMGDANDSDGAGGGDPSAQLFSTLLMVGGLVVVFYFFIIRPESKRKKAAAQMRKDLIVGDTITTIGGITGRVISIKDDTLTLESGPDRTKIVIMRWAMQSKGEQISDNAK